MGTTLVFSTALLFVAAIATGLNTAVSSTPTTSTTSTTPATKLPSTIEANGAAKSKRGVVEINPNIWANTAGFQSKSANPSTSSAVVNHNSDSHSPQRISSSSSAYSPAQNNGQPPVYNNQNSGYRHASPYSSLSYTNVGEGFGNAGQTYGVSEPSFGNTGQSYVSSPQNYGTTGEVQNSGFTSFYAPQSLSTGGQSSPNYGGFQETQPLTSSSQAQNGQGNGQIQNGAISTPYYTSFASAPSPVKIFTDKLPAGQYGASLVQLPNEQQNVHKSQSMYAPNHQSSSYIIPNIGSYQYQQAPSVNQGSPYISQGGPVFAATSQIHRNTLKTNFPGVKGQEFAQIYAPHHQSASTFVPNVQSNGFGPATVEFNGKKIPLPVLQLQSAEDFPSFAQSVQSQPLVLEANTPFQNQNEFGFLSEFAKNLNTQGGNILPFVNPQQPNQPQVLPVRSANGSPEFPQYKGARINTSPNYNQGRPSPSYEPLNTQPQLHFTGKAGLPPAPAPAPLSTSSVIHHPPLSARPVAEIRDDVEIIKKKKPTPPPHDFDEDELDEGYKSLEREYGRQNDEEEDDGPQRGKHFKESNTESDFKPSKSFPFKLYDDQFHKYSKPSASDEDSEEERPAARYRHTASAEEDDDYDGYSSTHHADYRSPKARPSRYEDDGEESQRHEKQEEAEEDEEPQRRPALYSTYGKDFEQEFEDSYRRELPKTKYVHIKEVPDIDEPSTSSHKSYSSSESAPKSSRQKARRGYQQSHDEDPEESKNYGSHTSQRYNGKVPKNRDSEGYGSNIRSYNKGPSPKVIHEESFGYKAPDTNGYSKYKKSPTGDSYSSVKKSPKMDSYLQASRSSYKSPKNDKAYENGDSYSYKTGSSWKSDKKSPESSGDFHGHETSVVKTLALPDQKSSFHAPAAIDRGNFFLSRNNKIVRDLTGI